MGYRAAVTSPGRDPSETAPWSSPLNAPWAFYGDLTERQLGAVDLGDQDEWERQLWKASELLWAMTGRRWRSPGGQRTVTVRSLRPRPSQGLDWPYHQSWGACRCWAWGEVAGGGVIPPWDYGGVHHRGVLSFRLPDPDATDVADVQLGGQPFDGWRYDPESGWLHRTDGKRWPVCLDQLQVTYGYGYAPPLAGVDFAKELAVEFARHATGDEKCRLPSRITSITRQNLAMTMASSDDVAKSRLTGVGPIDQWIVSVNPYLRPAEAQVVSPDVPTARS